MSMCDICMCTLHVMYHDRNMPETFEAQVSQFSGEKTVLSFASACCFDRCLPVASTGGENLGKKNIFTVF
jgi:hypothetical protein